MHAWRKKKEEHDQKWSKYNRCIQSKLLSAMMSQFDEDFMGEMEQMEPTSAKALWKFLKQRSVGEAEDADVVMDKIHAKIDLIDIDEMEEVRAKVTLLQKYYRQLKEVDADVPDSLKSSKLRRLLRGVDGMKLWLGNKEHRKKSFPAQCESVKKEALRAELTQSEASGKEKEVKTTRAAANMAMMIETAVRKQMQENAMAAHEGREPRDQRFCTKCNKRGHTADNCWADRYCEKCKMKGHSSDQEWMCKRIQARRAAAQEAKRGGDADKTQEAQHVEPEHDGDDYYDDEEAGYLGDATF